MNVKGVIFDLNGVIISTDEYHYRAWKMIFDGENIPFDRKVNERLRGVSRMESLEIGLEKSARSYSTVEKFDLADRKNSIYKKYLEELKRDEILPGVLDGTEELKRMGIKIAIASSSKNARLILEKIGLSDYFDAVVDGTEINKGKPNPEVFLLAAERLGTRASESMVVEDAEAGIEAAKRAGMISVATGFAAALNKADYTVKTLREIPNIVIRLSNDD